MENRDALERMRKLSNLQPLSESKVYKAEDDDVLAEGYDGDALVEMTLGVNTPRECQSHELER